MSRLEIKCPETIEELAGIIAGYEKVRVRLGSLDDGYANLGAWSESLSDLSRATDYPGWIEIGDVAAPPGPFVDRERMTGIVEYRPDDQVVTVRAGTWIWDLQEELAKHRQCIGLPTFEIDRPFLLQGYSDQIGDMIDLGFPHVLQAQCGSWKDWILGMTVVLADGTVAKCGSKVVKNVTGYDVHKLFVGARGTLGVIADVTMKTFPLGAVPKPDCRILNPWSGITVGCVQRTQRSDFEELAKVAEDKIFALDDASSSAWLIGIGEDVPRFPNDHRHHLYLPEKDEHDPSQLKLMLKAKEVFDPTHKLNPGEMGIF